MPLNGILGQFRLNVAQCDNLIVAAHRVDASGYSLFSQVEREQITVAAFLNFFKAWEAFLEASIAQYLVGSPTISGRHPVRYAIPTDTARASRMVVGTMRYFDYANHDNVRTFVDIFFSYGHPYEPHLTGIVSDLNDLKTMRNAAAHISATTQKPLESLALRLLGAPHPGITLYSLLTFPRGGATVFSICRDKIVVVAELIATG